ncbi:MAG TPA: hypothetical protein VFM51_09305 [Solirubrobacterales bacterium]|nr:hypothetical protein [Solirubrobacterales bacterium]
MADAGIADRQFTIEHYLQRSKRPFLPLALGFLQLHPEDGGRAPGPLSKFVKRGRGTALEQYLLLHAIASGEDAGFDVRLGAATWARAIGGYFDPETGVVEPAALHAVSRNWKFLRDIGLVQTERVGRKVRAVLLADDGSKEPYQHVGAGKKGKKLDGPGYFKLPYDYWRQHWHERLSLPAKAILLISLYQGDGFSLPYEKLPAWYGISAATGERGLRELRERGLIHRERHRRPDPESPVGFSYVYHYQLLPPFGPRGEDSRAKPIFWQGPASKPARKQKKKSAKKPRRAKQRRKA